ncbi:MAG: septation regulator SpoVG [Oligoflexia bacterium]|nr:septation regulator SpoVG [Oligoflexia bacterium]
MEITEVKVFAVNEERLKAYVTITIDACFVVRDLKIINGTNGLFVAMPSKKRKDGQFKDIAHPLNNETREKIENKIFEVYEAELKKMGQTLEQMTIAKSSTPDYDQSDDDGRA